MRYVKRSVVLVGAVAVSFIMGPTASAFDHASCSVRGGGVTDDQDQFSGSASTENSEADGRWKQRTVSGDRLLGSIEGLDCLSKTWGRFRRTARSGHEPCLRVR